MVAIGGCLPFSPPSRKEEAGAGRVEIVDGPEQPGHPARCKDDAMKGPVGFFPSLRIAGPVAGAGGIFGLIENGLGQMRRGIAQRQHFKRGTHLGDFPDFLGAETGNTNPPARFADHEPLRLEASERLAYRHMARTELFGNMVLAQLRAGLYRAGNDPISKRPADPDGDGVRFGCRHGFIDNEVAGRGRAAKGRWPPRDGRLSPTRTAVADRRQTAAAQPEGRSWNRLPPSSFPGQIRKWSIELPARLLNRRLFIATGLAGAILSAMSSGRQALLQEARVDRNRVISKDGTRIAFDRSGQGPALILVGGALSDRSGWAPLAQLLAPRFTVISYDRRGRGESEDTPPYTVEREVEDLEALIDEAGGAAFVHGQSSGAVLALEATAKLPDKVSKLSLYEPPFIIDDSRPPPPENYARQINELIAANRRGDAVAFFMTEVVGMPAEAVAQMRSASTWPALEALAHTLAYDVAILGDNMAGNPLPTEQWRAATAPALVMDGGASPQWIRNSARALADVLPNAQHRTLEGQAHDAAPEVLAPEIERFFVG